MACGPRLTQSAPKPNQANGGLCPTHSRDLLGMRSGKTYTQKQPYASASPASSGGVGAAVLVDSARTTGINRSCRQQQKEQTQRIEVRYPVG